MKYLAEALDAYRVALSTDCVDPDLVTADLSIEVVERIRTRLGELTGLSVPTTVVPTGGTPRGVAEILAETNTPSEWPSGQSGSCDERPLHRLWPVTEQQARVLIRDAESRASGNGPYLRTVSWYGVVEGRIMHDAFRQALRGLVSRHSALRTTFKSLDRGFAAIVRPPTEEPELVFHDLTSQSMESGASQALDLAVEAVEEPFDRGSLPRIRCALYEFSSGSTALFIAVDHFVADGRSMEIIVRDLAEMYTAVIEGRRSALPDVGSQFVDWVSSQQTESAAERRQELINYWSSSVVRNNFFPELRISRDNLTAIQGEEQAIVARQDIGFPRETSDLLDAFARACSVTPFTMYLALFFAFLYRMTGEHDITVCVPDDNRLDEDTENAVGWFAGAMVVHLVLPSDPTFMDVVEHARSRMIDAMDHRGLGLREVLTAVSGNQGHQPLGGISFEYTREMPTRFSFAGFSVHPQQIPFSAAFANPGVSMWTRRRSDGYNTVVLHGTRDHSSRLVAGLMNQWVKMAEKLLASPHTHIHETA